MAGYVFRSLTLAVILTTGLLSGCTAKPECELDSECASHQVCRAAVCRAPVLPELASWASDRASYEIEGDNLLVNGKQITPAGTSVFVGTQPTRIAVTPDGKYAVVNESTWGSNRQNDKPTTYYLRTVDLGSMTLVHELAAPNRLLWHGMHMVATTETTVWATDGRGEKLHQFAVGVTGALSYRKAIDLPGCYTTDVLIDSTGNRAFVTCLESVAAGLAGDLKSVDLATGTVTGTLSVDGAFSLWLSPDRKRLFVASIATVVQPEGDKVTVVNSATLQAEREIAVGLGPQGMAYSASTGELFVACNRTDDIHAIDVKSLSVTRVISLHNHAAPLKGMYPVRLAVDDIRGRLYVTASHENSIAVVELEGSEVEGFIPTGWYPNDVLIHPDGKTLVVSNGRGVGDGPSFFPGPGEASPGRALRGTVSTIPLPDANQLASFTAQVEQNNNRQSRYFDFTKGNDTPLPSPGAPTRASRDIKHVFFILKENFSYDAAFGDFERGEGDPEYTLWTEELIPNQRKLAREFTLFDNFYCESDSSLDGHAWAAAGIETDFMEKYNWFAEDFGVNAVSLTPGTVPQSKLFMPHLLDQGISVLGYGGIENFGAEAFGKFRENVAPGFHWYTQPDKTDVGRAEAFKREFNERLENDDMPAYSWIFLGNNHAFGLTPGEPIPEYWIGENDLAVGMVVGEIAASPIWKHSLILMTEDDAQSGLDHIDKHRCPAVAMGPWVKRGHTSSAVYTINNFQKTTELLLGSKPMHRLDDAATGMYDIFLARPDMTPFEPVIRDVPRTLYDGSNPGIVTQSARMDWSAIDLNPDAGSLYWRYRKGTEPPVRDPFYRHRRVGGE